MLEDMFEAVKFLDKVSIILKPSKNPKLNPVDVEGTRNGLILIIYVEESYFSKLPKGIQMGTMIRVSVAMFSQGINEAQTIAHTIGDTTLQDEINNFGLKSASVRLSFFLCFLLSFFLLCLNFSKKNNQKRKKEKKKEK